jgi:hypothetical protein
MRAIPRRNRYDLKSYCTAASTPSSAAHGRRASCDAPSAAASQMNEPVLLERRTRRCPDVPECRHGHLLHEHRQQLHAAPDQCERHAILGARREPRARRRACRPRSRAPRRSDAWTRRAPRRGGSRANSRSRRPRRAPTWSRCPVAPYAPYTANTWRENPGNGSDLAALDGSRSPRRYPRSSIADAEPSSQRASRCRRSPSLDETAFEWTLHGGEAERAPAAPASSAWCAAAPGCSSNGTAAWRDSCGTVTASTSPPTTP